MTRRFGGSFVLLAICVLSAPARGQTFSAEGASVQVAGLNGPWRFHTGDDPHWANPAFDDSAWQCTPFPQAGTQNPPAGGSEFVWYRIRIPTLAGNTPAAVLLPRVRTSYQLFADGHLVGGYGSPPPRPVLLVTQPQMFLLPGSNAATVTLAVRLWTFAGVDDSEPPLQPIMLQFGDRAYVRQQLELVQLKSRLALTSLHLFVMLSILGALASLAVYFSRRGEQEYLWFGLYLLFFAAGDIASILRFLRPLPYFSYGATEICLSLGGFLVELLLFRYLLKGSWNLAFWCACACVIAGSATWMADLTGMLGSFNAFNAFSIPVWTFYNLYILILTMRRAWQGMADARLILIPVCIVVFAWFAGDFLGLGNVLGLDTFGANELLNNTFQWPFPFSIIDITNLLFLVGMIAIMIRRFIRATQLEEQQAGELEAARAVQQVLVPAEIPAVPCFRIQSVYKPAGQVGGDFFQIMPLPSGGFLAVIGDVSGKGMPAAMTVSLLVGTLRTLAHYTNHPGEILAAMNQRMLARSSGGFTTCLVLRSDAAGELTIANAGHIAPYVAGKELPLANGLPLGLAADATYAERCFQLMPDQQLTLLTDGVVEARDQAGALFGFERSAALSAQPAEAIACAAQAFGQKDDITVLTLSYTGVPAST